MINQDRALSLLKQGLSYAAIGRELGCSRENIRQLRNRFTRDGKLSDNGRKAQAAAPRQAKPRKSGGGYTWDNVQAALVKTFEMARDYESMEAENRRLRNINAAQAAENKSLREQLKQSQEYNVMRQHGELPTPLR